MREQGERARADERSGARVAYIECPDVGGPLAPASRLDAVVTIIPLLGRRDLVVLTRYTAQARCYRNHVGRLLYASAALRSDGYRVCYLNLEGGVSYPSAY